MGKKVFCGFIFLMVLMGMIGVNQTNVMALTYTNEDGSYEYYYIESRTKVSIHKYSGTKEKVTIPSKIEDLPVGTIVSAFQGNKTVKEVILPTTVTMITDNTFNGCSNLTSVKLSDSLESIGISAFQNCTALKEIKIPDSVKIIKDSAFMGCSSLQKVNIPANLTQFGISVFKNCTAVKEISFSAKISEVPESTFSGCSALTKIILGNNIEKIGNMAFSNCESLTETVFPAKLKYIENRAFYNCKRMSEMYLPDTVERIGSNESNISDSIPASTDIYLKSGTILAKKFDSFGIKYYPKQDISKLTVKLNASYSYTGSKIEPAYNIIDSQGKVLEKAHLMSSCSGNVSVGTGTITITGKNKYYGTAKREFTINPAKTAGLKISKQESMALGLSWGAVKDISGYRIMLKNSVTGKFETIREVTSNSVEFASLKPGTVYTYKIVAYKKIGTQIYLGAESNEFVINTLPDAAANPVFKRSTTGSVELQWKAPSAKVKGYEVYRYNSGTKQYDKIVAVTGTSFKDTGLTAGTKYAYKIRAYIQLNGKTYYSAYTEKTDAVTLPATVKGLKQAEDSTSTTVRMKWDILKGVSGYEVYKYNTTSKTYKLANTRKSASVHSWTNSYLTPNTEYMYKVRAYVTLNGTNYYGSFSDVVKTSTTTKIPTVNLTQSKSTQVTVSWDKVEGATGYIVYYKTSPEAQWKALTQSTYNNTSYTKSYLKKGQKYYFSVKAVKLYNGIKLKSGMTSKSIILK